MCTYIYIYIYIYIFINKALSAPCAGLLRTPRSTASSSPESAVKNEPLAAGMTHAPGTSSFHQYLCYLFVFSVLVICA